MARSTLIEAPPVLDTSLAARRRARAAPAPPAPSPHELTPDETQQLIALIVEPLGGGETVSAGYARKEQAIGEWFARLTVIRAWALHRRLTCAAASDPLAAAFGRLVGERRGRLLAFLGDARRRAARAG